jgi:hypothetical protein
MRRLEDYLVEKLSKDPEFAAAFWEAENQQPIAAEIEELSSHRPPRLTFVQIMALPTAAHGATPSYERPPLRVIQTSAN